MVVIQPVKKGVCLVKTAVAQKSKICGQDEKVTPLSLLPGGGSARISADPF